MKFNRIHYSIKVSLVIALFSVLLSLGAGVQEEKKIEVTESILTASSTYDGSTPITSFDADLSQNSGWAAESGQKTAWMIVDFGSIRDLTRV